MKWVKWNIGNTLNSSDKLEEECKKRFKSLQISDRSCYKGDGYSFMSIETCKYKYDISNFQDDEICIFGDIEIFNLNEICNKYRIDVSDKPLLNLYKKCGSKMFGELNGEFSFILFDKREHKLFLVVDPLGIKELFWHYENKELNSSTDLFLLDELIQQEEFNKKYFRDFLKLKGVYSGNETPYTDIYRVKPGHYVAITLYNSNVEEIKYWDLSWITQKTYYESEELYFEKFRSLLIQALERRLLSEQNGIAMSGGLDSTTLFAITQKNLKGKCDLKPVSGVFTKFLDCDETELIREVCKMYETEPILVNCDDNGMLTNYPNSYPDSGEPHYPALSSSFTLEILKHASQNKIINLIDGYAADYLLSGTPRNSFDLLKKGKFFQTLKQIKNVSYMYDQSNYESVVKNLIKRKDSGIDQVMAHYIEKELNEIKTENQKYIYSQMFYAKTFKLLDREMAPTFNISVRHPFLDKDLIEFIYTIPGEMLLQKGVDKYLIREGLKEYLPQKVISKTQKTQHVTLSFSGINASWEEIYQEAINYRHGKFDSLKTSQDDWLEMLQNFRSGKVLNDEIFTRICLELWLSKN